MSPYDSLYPKLEQLGLSGWADKIKKIVAERLAADGHGKMEQWQQALAALPEASPDEIELKNEVVIGNESDLNDAIRSFPPRMKILNSFILGGKDLIAYLAWRLKRNGIRIGSGTVFCLIFSR